MGKAKAKRVLIEDSDFAPPITGTKGAVPNPKIDVDAVAKTAERLLNETKDQEDAEKLADSDGIHYEPEKKEAPETVLPQDLTVEKLYEMIQQLQGGASGSIESVWAKAMMDGVQIVEVDSAPWMQLTRAMNPKPTSVWYKDVRFFPKGTSEAILEEEGLSVDYVRGISQNKYAKNKFRGRS